MNKPRDLSTFCALPFSHLFANEIGEMYFCCMAVEENRPISDEAGKPYSFKNPSQIPEAWNSKQMREARLDLLSGRKPIACTRCFKFEENHLTSYRQHMGRTYGDIVDALIESTSEDGAMEFAPYSVDIRLGNTCNLKCRMCSPVASKALIDEWQQVFPEMGENFFTSLKNVDWFKSKEYWDVLHRHIGNIRNFHFAGGEPLLIKEMYDFLRKIIETGRAGEITLSYNTNATIMPMEIYELWPHFKYISVTLSADGTEKFNSYIRFPAKWSKVLSHLDAFDRDVEKLNIKHLSINNTVQAYNIFDVPDFVEFAVRRFKNMNYPMLSLLFNPSHLSAQVLPREIRMKAKAKLEAFFVRFKPEIESRARYSEQIIDLTNGITGLIDFLDKDDSKDHFPEFVRTTKQFDQIRGQSILEIMPELIPYWAYRETSQNP
jgi:sulfatase maturation enzyme AslB (radical SAM superfamily)